MAIIGRNHPDERRMTDLLKKWSTLDGLKTEEFNLKKMPPYHEPTLEILQEHAYFWQSDNSRFWFYKEGSSFTSFPALLLTDTGTSKNASLQMGRTNELTYESIDEWSLTVMSSKNKRAVICFAFLCGAITGRFKNSGTCLKNAFSFSCSVFKVASLVQW